MSRQRQVTGQMLIKMSTSWYSDFYLKCFCVMFACILSILNFKSQWDFQKNLLQLIRMFLYNISDPKFFSVLKVIFNFRKTVLDLNFLIRLVGFIDAKEQKIPNY